MTEGQKPPDGVRQASSRLNTFRLMSSSSNRQTRRKAGTQSHGPTALTSLRGVARLPKGWLPKTDDSPHGSGWFHGPATPTSSWIDVRSSGSIT